MRTGRRPTVCIFQRFMPPDPSGAGKQAVTLARVIHDHGWDVVFLTEGEPGEDRIEGFPSFRIRALPPDPSYAQILAYWARAAVALTGMRERFDVLHVHSMAFDQLGAVPAARLLGKPVLVRSSISGEFDSLARSRSGRLQKNVLGLADAFVALSRRLARESREAGLEPEKVHRVPNGVDTSRYCPVDESRKQVLRRALNLPEHARLLVYHGVFIERKSILWLIETLESELADLDLTLLLVGGPARDECETGYAEQVRRRVEARRAENRIILRGFDPEVERYLQASDAYVLPSLGEGLPNAMLEAMACGLVPFATRTSGTEDVIEDGRSGFLFEPRNAAEFLGALRAVYGAGATNGPEEIARAAADRVRQHFSIQASGRRYADLYEELAG